MDVSTSSSPSTDGRATRTPGPRPGGGQAGSVRVSPVALRADIDPGTRLMAFYETLVQTLRPRSVSDRTCFRRVALWLGDQVKAGRFDDDMYARVLLYAREATTGYARNPHAVFMSTLRKELDYDPKHASR